MPPIRQPLASRPTAQLQKSRRQKTWRGCGRLYLVFVGIARTPRWSPSTTWAWAWRGCGRLCLVFTGIARTLRWSPITTQHKPSLSHSPDGTLAHEGRNLLALEDVARQYKKPCVLDVKVRGCGRIGCWGVDGRHAHTSLAG
eukprot:359317-Chlamydomonas_euryale.AAC.1